MERETRSIPVIADTVGTRKSVRSPYSKQAREKEVKIIAVPATGFVKDFGLLRMI